MGVTARWRREVAAHPVASDVALAAAVLLINLAQPGHTSGREPVPLTPTTVALSIVACGALVFRRRWPVSVLAVTLVASLAYVVAAEVKSPIGLTVGIATYTLVVNSTRRTKLTGCVIAAIVLMAGAALFTDGTALEHVGVAVLVLLGVAVGEAVRNRRAYVEQLEERARQAEQSREEEAHRRVIEERLRIAHELHDVIAHHIALMNVQAGVASHVLRDDPGQAAEALAHVRDGGRSVLRELTVLLDVLRENGETATPTEPLPSVRRLGELTGKAAAAGLAVDWEPYDEPLPAPVDLVTYRVLQESLTNVLKHAPGASVRLRLRRVGDRLHVDVTDDGGATGGVPRATGSGHGLAGMRERVAAIGGDFSAGPDPAGGFGVHAELPLSEREDDEGDDPGTAGRRPDADPQRIPRAGRLGAGSRGGR
jgi:signal transduction histidine kinase